LTAGWNIWLVIFTVMKINNAQPPGGYKKRDSKFRYPVFLFMQLQGF